ncbi:MAG: transposase [Planctomycetes bacterium]|nr:transposase [Planctomycetota bacterium]
MIQKSAQAQRFGSSLALNIHFHALELDGVYTADSPDAIPVFHPPTCQAHFALNALLSTACSPPCTTWLPHSPETAPLELLTTDRHLGRSPRSGSDQCLPLVGFPRLLDSKRVGRRRMGPWKAIRSRPGSRSLAPATLDKP